MPSPGAYPQPHALDCVSDRSIALRAANALQSRVAYTSLMKTTAALSLIFAATVASGLAAEEPKPKATATTSPKFVEVSLYFTSQEIYPADNYDVLIISILNKRLGNNPHPEIWQLPPTQSEPIRLLVHASFPEAHYKNIEDALEISIPIRLGLGGIYSSSRVPRIIPEELPFPAPAPIKNSR